MINGTEFAKKPEYKIPLIKVTYIDEKGRKVTKIKQDVTELILNMNEMEANNLIVVRKDR